MTVISITKSTKALPACNQRVQKQFSYYESVSEFIITLQNFKRELNPPDSAIYVIDWFVRKAEKAAQSKQKAKYGKAYGCFFACNQTIADETGVSIRTIQDGFKWLKSIGVFFVKRTKGVAYKYWAKAKEIKAAVENYFGAVFAHHSAEGSAHHSAHPESEQIPCESKSESPKKADHINTVFNNNKEKHYQNNYSEEEAPAITPKKIKFKSEFSEAEIRQAFRFVVPQMRDTIEELNWNSEFANRFICYMEMAGMTYIAPFEIRQKNIEIEKAGGKDKKGRKIEDMALYMVKGITMKRQGKNADRASFLQEKAKKQAAMEKKKREQQQEPQTSVPFYNWLDNVKPQKAVEAEKNDSEGYYSRQAQKTPQTPSEKRKYHKYTDCGGDF